MNEEIEKSRKQKCFLPQRVSSRILKQVILLKVKDFNEAMLAVKLIKLDIESEMNIV